MLSNILNIVTIWSKVAKCDQMWALMIICGTQEATVLLVATNKSCCRVMTVLFTCG